MKKLISFLLFATFCLGISGCSNDKVEEVEKDNDRYEETIALEDGQVKENRGTFFPSWEHTTNRFTNKIFSMSFENRKARPNNKPITTVYMEIESINKSDKDVYHSLDELIMVDDKGHRAILTSTSWTQFEKPERRDDIVKVVPAGKKNKDIFQFRFDDVENYQDIKSVTLKYPMVFGADDDADQEKKYNEITFEFK